MIRIVLVIMLLFLGMGTTFAQEGPYTFVNTPLKEVMLNLETRNNLKFSFAEDLVADKTVSLQIETIDITGLLDILEAQTGLRFEQLDQNQIIVSPIGVGDEICLSLLDNETKLPISYSTVIIDSTEFIASDKKGFVRFNGDDLSNVLIKVSGYEAAIIQKRDYCQQVYLSPKYSELEGVVVTGYITTGIDRNTNGSITLGKKPLGLLPGLTTPDILQSIQVIPGVTSLDESASDIQIHGGSSDQNLVLFDNIRIFNTGYLYGMLSRFNPYATQNATVYKSGTSPVYGDRISGVIDIRTDENLVQNTSGGFGLDGLSFDGYLKTPLNPKASLFVYGRRAYTDFYQSPTYEGFAKKIFDNTGITKYRYGNPLNINTDNEYTPETSTNEFKFYDVNAKYIYQPSLKDQIEVSALMTRNKTYFSFLNSGEISSDSLATGNGGISAAWTHTSSPSQTDEIVAYFSSYDSQYDNVEYLDQTLEEANTRANRISDIGLSIRSERNLSNGNELRFGYQLSNTKLEVNLSENSMVDGETEINLNSEESNFKNALFGEYLFKFKNGSHVDLGLRTVHYGSLGNIYLEPRLNSELAFSNSLRLYAGIERRNQPVSQIIEFNQTELRLENNLWRLSDNNEYPLLQSNQISMGLLYHKNGWTLDVEGYVRKLIGLTSFSQGFNLPQPFLSSGQSSVVGADVLVKKRIEDYRLWLGYTFNTIEYTFDEINDGDFPGNNDITHNFRISNSLKLLNLELSLGWQYRTGKPLTPIETYNEETGTVTFGAVNSIRLPSYHRLDASLTYDMELNQRGGRVQFGFSALNLYDRRIPLSIVYRVMQENEVLKLEQAIHRKSLGFTPNMNLRFFF
ncbi:TonB-dependent receptor [Maribacter cobaltidurans]|uniref:Uncharacterized protein n=1 Tax=Maribacter cobaltidurans TaxID=1178778 RepID=A0A223V1F7_9FLAO|nr:TonB-dependent receptor [Maribacter cobaltidurans]ASV29213.1 hypothetical protein CJ263_02660 [Maribacter cobaltidurans]GGD70980.1 TonB-dependent receptor [Maribacter cobaltidurans]